MEAKIQYARNWKELNKIMKDINMCIFPLEVKFKKDNLWKIKFCNKSDWKRLRDQAMRKANKKINGGK